MIGVLMGISRLLVGISGLLLDIGRLYSVVLGHMQAICFSLPIYVVSGLRMQ